METRETERFVRVGRSYLLIVLGIAPILPLAIGFVITFVMGESDLTIALAMSAVAAFVIWLWILMSISWGGFLGFFVKNQEKGSRSALALQQFLREPRRHSLHRHRSGDDRFYICIQPLRDTDFFRIQNRQYPKRRFGHVGISV